MSKARELGYHISAVYPDGDTQIDFSKALVAENESIKSVGGKPLFYHKFRDRKCLVWYKPGEFSELKNGVAKKVERNGEVSGYMLEVFDDSSEAVKFKQRVAEAANEAQLKGLEPQTSEIQEYMHRYSDKEDVLPRWVLLMKSV